MWDAPEKSFHMYVARQYNCWLRRGAIVSAPAGCSAGALCACQLCYLGAGVKMAESLRRLANIGSFTLLQDKLDKWLDDYHASILRYWQGISLLEFFCESSLCGSSFL